MSSVWWCLILNDLLEYLQNEVLLVYGYADDLATLIGGISLIFLGILRLKP
jgi:hypothetical protein